VAAGLPHGHVQHLRGDDLLVAFRLIVLPHEIDQQVVDQGPLGVEEGTGRRFRVEAEQVQLLPKLAMVPGLGLLEPLQMLVQFLLGVEGRAVDAAHGRIFLVPFPVRSSGIEQLEGLELAGAGHMGSPAEVVEVPLGIPRDDLVLGNIRHQLHLEVFPHRLEPGHRIIAEQFLADHGKILSTDPPHFGLDGLQVFGREEFFDQEIVVEPVLDHGADTHPGRREQVLHSLRQQMGRGMADHLQTFGILAGDQGHPGSILKWTTKIHNLPIRPNRQRGLQKARTDGGRQILTGGAVAQFADRVVGKSYLDGHGYLAGKNPV